MHIHMHILFGIAETWDDLAGSGTAGELEPLSGDPRITVGRRPTEMAGVHEIWAVRRIGRAQGSPLRPRCYRKVDRWSARVSSEEGGLLGCALFRFSGAVRA